MRKKFTLLFAALLAFVGVVKAEVNNELLSKKITIGTDATTLSTDQWYVLYNHGRGVCVSEETTAFKMRSIPANDAVAQNMAGMFFKLKAVEGQSGQYYIESGNGLYFDFVENNTSSVSENSVAYKVAQIGENQGHFYIQKVENDFVADGQGNGDNFVCYNKTVPTSIGGNNCYHFKPVTLTEAEVVEVVYNYTYGNETKYTEKIAIEKNSDYPDYTVVLPEFVSAEEKPTGKVTVNETVNIALTVAELPFTTTMVENGELKNTVWHKVYMGKGSKSWSYNSEANNIDVANKPEDGDYTSAYMFAFVGDVFNGFKIYNKYLGASKVLWQSTGDVNDSGVAITMANASDAIGGNWILEYNQESEGKDYYVFRRDEVNQAYMNPRGNKLSYWLSSWGKTDGPATISFVEVTNEELVALAKVDFDAIFAKASGINDGIGTGVGQYTVPANFADVYAEAVAISEQETPNGNEMETVTASLKELVGASTLNLPSEDKFYVIKSAKYEGGLVYANEENRIYWSTEKTAAANSETIWQFEGTENGSLKLRNVHNNQYISELGWTVASFLGDEAECLFTIIAQGAGVVFIKGLKDNFSEMHAQGSGTGGELVRYNTNTAGSASSWIVEEVAAPTYTLSVTDAGWASLVLGFNATIPSGVKAYIVSGVAGDKATLEQVSGTVLPANTPVLIEAAKGDYEFAHTTTSATVAGNILQGKPYNTYLQTVAGTTNYVLSDNDGIVALYKKTVYDADRSDDDDVKDAEGKVTEAKNDHILFAANKAYLPVDGSAKAISLDRGEGTTGIKDAELTIGNVVIYDLAGRRVEKMEKGIYIVNGKKVVIK